MSHRAAPWHNWPQRWHAMGDTSGPPVVGASAELKAGEEMANVEKPPDWTDEHWDAYFGSPGEVEEYVEFFSDGVVDVPEASDGFDDDDDGGGSA